MSHLNKDYQQQEQALGHGYTHKKFNRVYTHKKLGLCLRQREQENKENRVERVIPAKSLFRPYDLGANTPRRRRVSSCFESNQSQSSSQACESAEENYMPAINTPQSSPLSLETPKQNSTPPMYTQQFSAGFCEFVKENYPPNTCTPPQSSSSSSCDPTEENYALSTYAPQSPASSCESVKENDNTSMYTPQSSPPSCETSREPHTLPMYTPQSSPLSCETTEENYTPAINSPHYSPQSYEPAQQNYTPQSSDFVKENSTSSKSSRQSLSRSCESNRGNYTPPIYPPQSSSPRALVHGNIPAESNSSYILRLQGQRAALYMHYLYQFQQLPAINLQTPMGYPMGYPNVTAPIFNGY